MMPTKPVGLEGKHAVLEPLHPDHLDGLWNAGSAPELRQWTQSTICTRNDMKRYVETALHDQQNGTAIPFVIVEAGSRAIIGSTRYGNVSPAHRRIEIGWTWISPQWQRTAVNTECKFLLLRHAFETLGCIRVELKTDALNTKSRNAILRIGAKEEGMLRKHLTTASGRIRDTVYYSILDTEWPQVKSRLENLLQTPIQH